MQCSNACPVCASFDISRRSKLFDHLVAVGKKRRRNDEPECLGDFERDRKLVVLFISVAYCDANVWRYFRQAAPRAAGDGSRAVVDQKIEDQAEHRQSSRIFLQIGEGHHGR